ncbi:hypothetical protein ACOMHN_031561 [Nucella lapillus]
MAYHAWRPPFEMKLMKNYWSVSALGDLFLKNWTLLAHSVARAVCQSAASNHQNLSHFHETQSASHLRPRRLIADAFRRLNSIRAVLEVKLAVPVKAEALASLLEMLFGGWRDGGSAPVGSVPWLF